MIQLKFAIPTAVAFLLGWQPSGSLAQTEKAGCVTTFQYATQRLFVAPDSQFAVMAFYEHALGTYLGVIYYGQVAGADTISSPWGSDHRFWQDTRWASDATGFCWSPSGRYLYVATSGIYGEGGLFELDLSNRRSKLLFPTANDPFYRLAKKYGCLVSIVRLDPNGRRLYFTATTLDPAMSTKVSRDVVVR